MSTPPDALMKLMGGGGTGAPAGPTSMTQSAPGNEPPGGGPMATPAPKEGEMQKAMVNISMTMKILENSLPAFGSTSDEGKAVLAALTTLTKAFGAERRKSEELIPAELMQLVQQVPGMGGGGPAGKTMGGMPGAAPAM